MLRQITFFRVSQVPKRFSVAILWNFQCVNAWTNIWNKMMEEDTGVERQNSKKGVERMSMPAAWREFSWFWI